MMTLLFRIKKMFKKQSTKFKSLNFSILRIILDSANYRSGNQNIQAIKKTKWDAEANFKLKF